MDEIMQTAMRNVLRSIVRYIMGVRNVRRGTIILSLTLKMTERELILKVNEQVTLINLAEESEFEADKMEGDSVCIGMNGALHAEVSALELLSNADIKVNGEQPAHHDQSDVTEEAQQSGYSRNTHHDRIVPRSTKPALTKATEKLLIDKRKSHSIVPRGKIARPSSAPTLGTLHAQSEPDRYNRAKHATTVEVKASDCALQSGRAAHT
nr:uncharacterized protein LOC112273134 isoform X2 [Physcomitrium patens]|eukprot:XP_024357349.1 uncharacterized protein LOC112273134 isoform X2 [Physcomitrella patens]